MKTQWNCLDTIEWKPSGKEEDPGEGSWWPNFGAGFEFLVGATADPWENEELKKQMQLMSQSQLPQQGQQVQPAQDELDTSS